CSSALSLGSVLAVPCAAPVSPLSAVTPAGSAWSSLSVVAAHPAVATSNAPLATKTMFRMMGCIGPPVGSGPVHSPPGYAPEGILLVWSLGEGVSPSMLDEPSCVRRAIAIARRDGSAGPLDRRGQGNEAPAHRYALTSGSSRERARRASAPLLSDAPEVR